MDFLTRLPVIGPVAAWVLRSRPYRTYQHLSDVKGNRLAGAVTFYGFLALFPLLTVAMAIAAATLSDSRLNDLKKTIADQLPGLSKSINLDGLVANAATIGLVSAVVLVFSGLGWVDALRGAIRAIWWLPEDKGNFVLKKARDCMVLAGLGLVGAVSFGASTLGSLLVQRLAQWVGLDGGPARWLLTVVGYLIAVGVDLLLFAYLLGPFANLADQRGRDLLQGALIGAVGFEVLKLAIASYLGKVAAKSVYGAFGVPIAMLVWIDFVTRLLLFCAAWTALADPVAARERSLALARAALADASAN